MSPSHNFLEAVVKFLFDAVAEGRKEALQTRMDHDPKLQALLDELGEVHTKITAHVERQSQIVHAKDWQETLKRYGINPTYD